MKIMSIVKTLLNINNIDDESKHITHIQEYNLSFLEKISNTYNIECEKLKTESARILQLAFLNGHCGIAKFNDGFYVGSGEYVGEHIDKNGFLNKYMITFENGETYTGEVNKDIVVLHWNNLQHSQVNLLQWFSEMLADTDLSMKYNIKYTRVCPIPIVRTDIEEKSIRNVIDNLFKGKLAIFKRSSAIDLMQNDREHNTLDLTQPQATTYLQHLSRFHDELIQRICLEFGVYVSVRDKGAQLNNAELGAFSDYCAISSDDTYNQLLKWSKKCKEVFNIDIKITPKSFIYTENDVRNNENEMENEKNETDRDMEE